MQQRLVCDVGVEAEGRCCSWPEVSEDRQRGCREDRWVRQREEKKKKKRGKALFVVCHSLSACKMLQEGCHRGA